MIVKFLTDENRKKTGNILFYIALTIELLLMIIEKSELPFPYESYVFRVTFLITLVAALVMKRSVKEWVFVALTLVFTGFCYVYSGKNDLLRFSTFVIAARDIDLKKAMKYSFYMSAAGFLVIALLSVFGILGNIYSVADFGRGIADEKRYVFGFGHPNTLFGCIYALILMWLWIYGCEAGIVQYAVLILLSIIASVITRSRTGVAVLAVTLVLAVILRLFPKLKDVRAMYILESIVSPVLCLVTAVMAAGYSEGAYVGSKIFRISETYWRIDGKLNNRISNLYYEVEDHGGILSNWKLFAGHGADSYFDMGWVRLFYWYGIIPTLFIAAVIAAIIFVCYKKRDLMSLVILCSLSIYTIVEATFVSRYIGRNFFLLITGAYLGYLFKKEGTKDAGEA